MGLKRRIRVEPEFSLAAMIDVIFLLLMFFMLTSNSTTQSALNLQLPSSTSKTMASPSLEVGIRDGQFFIDGKLVAKGNLEAVLRTKVAALVADDKSKTVTVAAQKDVIVDDLVYVLDIANRLKLKTVLKTKPVEGLE